MIVKVVFAIFVLFLAAFGIQATSVDAGERFEVSLIHTIDGDTARFMINGKDTRVRFLGIDAPEMGFTRVNGRVVVDPNSKEPGARAATEKVDRLLQNANTIYLELDPARGGYDRFGRLRA